MTRTHLKLLEAKNKAKNKAKKIELEDSKSDQEMEDDAITQQSPMTNTDRNQYNENTVSSQSKQTIAKSVSECEIMSQQRATKMPLNVNETDNDIMTDKKDSTNEGDTGTQRNGTNQIYQMPINNKNESAVKVDKIEDSVGEIITYDKESTNESDTAIQRNGTNQIHNMTERIDMIKTEQTALSKEGHPSIQRNDTNTITETDEINHAQDSNDKGNNDKIKSTNNNQPLLPCTSGSRKSLIIFSAILVVMIAVGYMYRKRLTR